MFPIHLLVWYEREIKRIIVLIIGIFFVLICIFKSQFLIWSAFRSDFMMAIIRQIKNQNKRNANVNYSDRSRTKQETKKKKKRFAETWLHPQRWEARGRIKLNKIDTFEFKTEAVLCTLHLNGSSSFNATCLLFF